MKANGYGGRVSFDGGSALPISSWQVGKPAADVKAAPELLDDSEIDVASFVNNQAAERLLAGAFMNEELWLAEASPEPLLGHALALLDGAGRPETEHTAPREAWALRKLRLWACACVRHPPVWLQVPDDARAELEAVEEDAASGRDFRPPDRRTTSIVRRLDGPLYHRERAALLAVADARMYAANAPGCVANVSRHAALLGLSRHAQADLLREVFGNVFRPACVCPACRGGGFVVTQAFEYRPPVAATCPGCGGSGSACPPSWRTGDVTAVARSIRRGRRWADLPVLADALEDAGCAENVVLDHLRHLPADAHAAGCWALDLVLGEG